MNFEGVSVIKKLKSSYFYRREKWKIIIQRVHGAFICVLKDGMAVS